MPGIAGIIHPKAFQNNQLIDSMLDVLSRGVDSDKQQYSYKNIQVGVVGCALASNEKKTLYLGINGTITNTEELLQEIHNHGHHIAAPQGQAELLLYAYELWGLKFLTKIDGDFAIIILNTAKDKLIIARDRIGKKPLYWFHDHHYFLFGSELKSLLATGAVPQTAAPDMVATYLFFGYLPQDLTIIKDVNKLLPGYSLTYNLNGSTSIESYWSYSSDFQKPTIKHKNIIAHDLGIHIEESIRKQIPDEETVGAFLSGGLGSGTIAYFLKKNTKKRKIKAFTAYFAGENDDDAAAAKVIAETLGIEHKVRCIHPKEFIDDLIPILWYLDEPLADPHIISAWNLSQMASGDVKTVFSGVASDELLASHSQYILNEEQSSFLGNLLKLPTELMYQILIPLMNYIDRPCALKLLRRSRTTPWQFDYLKQNALFDEKMLAQAAPKIADLFSPDVFLHKFHHLSRIKSVAASFFYLDVKTRLSDNYILQYERLTSAHGLKWKSPMSDYNLLEFLASIPDPQQLIGSEKADFLKIIMKNIYPEALVNRPKKAQGHFISTWITGSGLSEIFPMLVHGTLVDTGIISGEWIKTATASLEEQTKSFRYLWAILILEIWFRLYINRPIENQPPKTTLKELLKEI